MTFSLRFTRTFIKQLRKLEKGLQERIIGALERAQIRPEKHFERLVGSTASKLRIGDYRVIADINHEELQILALEADHRKRR